MNAVKNVSGRTYVFIMDKETQKPKGVQVQVGLENTNHVEIVSELKEGDEVIIPTSDMVDSLKNDRRRGPINPFQKK